MALTETGLTIPRLEEIVSDQGEKLRELLGVDIDITEDSVAGIINSIYSNSLADVYELAQAIYDSRDIYKAEGVQLDILASYLGTSRIPSSVSRVNNLFVGVNGTTIPQGNVVSTQNAGDRFETLATGTISNLSANFVEFTVDNVLDNTDYTVTVDGSDYVITSDANATQSEILNALEASLDTGIGFGTERTGSIIKLTAEVDDVYDPTQTIRVDLDTNLSFNEIASILLMVSEEDGTILATANSLTLIETPVNGLYRTYNPQDATLGRLIETDDELRARLLAAQSRAGAATFDAIGTQILEVDNVDSVSIIENDTINTVDGVPPKAFEVVVVGGDDVEIAQKIWDTKPAGIQTHGNVTESVTDFGGNLQSVNFSRPSLIYIHVSVDYVLYTEENNPTAGEIETAIINSVLDTGSALAAGNDVISARFIGPIYNSVTGLGNVVVKIGTTANPNDPTPVLTEGTIAIAPNEVSNFDSLRVIVTDIGV